jgi:hypothetical protein
VEKPILKLKKMIQKERKLDEEDLQKEGLTEMSKPGIGQLYILFVVPSDAVLGITSIMVSNTLGVGYKVLNAETYPTNCRLSQLLCWLKPNYKQKTWIVRGL